MTSQRKEALEQSREMEPVQGTVDVAIPVSVLWSCFARARWWPRWNTCMYLAWNRELVAGDQLLWAFDPIRQRYPYKLPGKARLVELVENSHVAWEVTVLPGFYARHVYFMEDLGQGRTRFGSWEKAMGPTFRLFRNFWLAHFRFVKERSLQGARFLEQLYRREGRLDGSTLPAREYLPFAGTFQALIRRPLALARIHYVPLGPGLVAALGGGGNSLLVEDGGEALLVDPKFPPFAGSLHRWVSRHPRAPVTTLVNTHFHYDHTWGNVLYPQARIVAQARAPELMRRRDARWWQKHPGGLPQAEGLLETEGRLKVGGLEVALHHTGQGHTATDLWLHLRRGDQEVVATGDVASLGIHPFFDLGEGGANVPGMIELLHYWARTFPQASFVPGHGPVATAADLVQHADYLAFLWEFVGRARAAGMNEGQTVAGFDLSRYRLSTVPMFHYGETLLSARSNLRAIYRLQARGE